MAGLLEMAVNWVELKFELGLAVQLLVAAGAVVVPAPVPVAELVAEAFGISEHAALDENYS